MGKLVREFFEEGPGLQIVGVIGMFLGFFAALGVFLLVIAAIAMVCVAFYNVARGFIPDGLASIVSILLGAIISVALVFGIWLVHRIRSEG